MTSVGALAPTLTYPRPSVLGVQARDRFHGEGNMKLRYMDCPCCGSKLTVVDHDLVTLEEAQDDEMDSRIERDRLEEAEPDGA